MTAIFSIQDNSGTVALLEIVDAPAHAIVLGDTGTYSGIAFNGTQIGTPVDLPFTVGQVFTATQFGVTTANCNLADWPDGGTITWLTGANTTSPNTSLVSFVAGANAYIDVDFFETYHNSRGNVYGPISPVDAVQQAIVKATDYLDQKYRFKGVKLLQTLGDPGATYDIGFLDPWVMPFAFGNVPYLTPTTTTQSTQWPRQGVVDFSGDSINGIPRQIKFACAELALRVLNGVNLQPDYNSDVVTAGAIVSEISKQVGPLRTDIKYDTKLGIGFFASFPQIDRMLNSAGLLVASGGRTIMR